MKNIFTDINYLQVTNSLNPEGNPEAALKFPFFFLQFYQKKIHRFGENIVEFYERVQEDVEYSKNMIYENIEGSSLKVFFF